MLVLAMFGQQAPPVGARYAPSEVQSLRLQVRQKDAQIAQNALEKAQLRFQQTLVDLQAEAERIKTENKWPKDTQFDPNNLVFNEPPTPSKKDK
jgi:hypothetical protein